jgi:hypothetical protein
MNPFFSSHSIARRLQIGVGLAALSPLLGGDAWVEFESLVQSYAFADAEARLAKAIETFQTP